MFNIVVSNSDSKSLYLDPLNPSSPTMPQTLTSKATDAFFFTNIVPFQSDWRYIYI